MSSSCGSWWKAIKQSMLRNMQCCSAKIDIEEDFYDESLTSKHEGDYVESYKEVDPRDVASLPPVGGTSQVKDCQDEELQTLSRLARLRIFLQKLKFSRKSTPQKKQSGSSFLSRVISKHSNKVFPETMCKPVEENVDEVIDTSVERESSINEPNDGEDSVEQEAPVALESDSSLFEEEAERQRSILLEDNLTYEDYLKLSDEEKAQNVDEMYQSMDKSQQHEVRYQSYALVNDIMSSLFD